jgi:hypothetical protein
MDDLQMTPVEAPRSALARWGRPGAFAAAGLVAGGLLAGSLTASAADSGSTSTPSPSSSSGDRPGTPPSWTGNTEPSQPQRSDEELLTGTPADKVEKAALATYPGATVVRIETDSDGVYEAHLTKADGTPVTVEVDESFTVTGTEEGGFGGGQGAGPGGGTPPTAGSESGTTTSGYAA